MKRSGPAYVGMSLALTFGAGCASERAGEETVLAPNEMPSAGIESTLPLTAASEQITPVTTPAVKQEYVVFSSDREGQYDVYALSVLSGALLNLTNTPNANEMNARYCASDDSLVYYSDATGTNDIYKRPFMGGVVLRLTTNGAQNYDPVCLENGILYKSNQDDAHSGNGDIWFMGLDGSGARNLTPFAPDTEEWKPEPYIDNKIIYTRRFTPAGAESDELFVLDLTTGVETRLTNNNVPDWFAAPNNNGDMAYISKEANGGPDSLFIRYPDGTVQPLVTQAMLPGDNDDPFWDSAGNVYFLNNGTDGTYDIYVREAATGLLRLVDDAPNANNLSPISITR